MRVAHREITKKHLKRMAEEVAEELELGDNSGNIFETYGGKCLRSHDNSQFIRNDIRDYTVVIDSDDFLKIYEKNKNVYEFVKFYLPEFTKGDSWDFTTDELIVGQGEAYYDKGKKVFKFRTDDTQGRTSLLSLMRGYFKCDVGGTGAVISKYDKIGGVALDDFVHIKGFDFVSNVKNKEYYLLYCESDLRWKLFDESEVNKNENE